MEKQSKFVLILSLASALLLIVISCIAFSWTHRSIPRCQEYSRVIKIEDCDEDAVCHVTLENGTDTYIGEATVETEVCVRW